jgi:gamma-glutamyl:cysteine ligase YbdK (ATP-grasp superfamily)
MNLKFGIEEEIFLIDKEKGKPAVDSLYPLYTLFRKNPAFYYFHTAVNLARSREFFDFFVASVEISTPAVSSVEGVVGELALIRKELVQNCPQKVACVGMLPQYTANKSLVAGLHLHLSGEFDLEKTRLKLAHYLPALLLLTANSPSLENEYLSNRILLNPFAGSLVSNAYERFQDIIVSRRLKTLEIRIFDPCPDLERYYLLLEAVKRIIELNEEPLFEPDRYVFLRRQAACYGMKAPAVRDLVYELTEKIGFKVFYFETPPAIRTKELLEKHGVEKAFDYLDSLYRDGVQFDGNLPPKSLRALIGFFGYYLPKMPYITYKFLKEHGYL